MGRNYIKVSHLHTSDMYEKICKEIHQITNNSYVLVVGL